jgi:NADH-quinone oxidoreductase subunit J
MQPSGPMAPNLSLSLAAALLHPVALLTLCVIAGIGTALLLPGRREPSVRKIGGAVLLAAMLILGAILARQGTAAAGADAYFWLFSAIAILSAVRVISHTRPVYSALYFVLTVLAVAGLFILLWAEFMAAALVLIYAGAILVTYVFVIMLASQAQAEPDGTLSAVAECDRLSRAPAMASAVGFTAMGLLLFLIADRAESVAATTAHGQGQATSIQDLGVYLFREHMFALELAGVLLVLSMVGAVVIARRRVEGAARAAPQRPTIGEDDPHTIPVTGTTNPAAKAYPES